MRRITAIRGRCLSGLKPSGSQLLELKIAGSEVAEIANFGPQVDPAGRGGRRAAGEGAAVEPPADEPPLWILPGLLDMQINGYTGHDLNGDDVTWEIVTRMVEAVWATGVPLMCPTVITGSRERMENSIAAIAEACRRDPLIDKAVVGIHVEGPFISPLDGPRGAHPPEHVRPPDWAEFESWQRLCDGRIRLVTVAPETEGALDFIRRATAAGVTVSIGHTDARAEKIRAAIAAGARLSTHLGNGSHAMLPRLDNCVWEQLAADELTASIIVDGHHLPPAVVKCFYRVKGAERLVLISDASPIAGLPPGRYPGFHGEVDLLPNGRIQMVGGPYLAGSGRNLLDCVNGMREMTGAGIDEVVGMASLHPQRMLGLSGRTGWVAEGGPATFSVVSEAAGRLRPEATILAGHVVWESKTFSSISKGVC